MTCLQRTSRVFIVSSSPIYAGALRQLIESSRQGARSEIVVDPTLPFAAPNSPSDLALLAPRDWRELGAWINPLHKKLHAIPWLILADPRVAGLFLPRLNTQPCRIVDPAGTPIDLAAPLRATPTDHCLHLPTTFMTLFARSETFRPSPRAPRMPSMVEQAISCGVSLGLSNPEMADVLHVTEATVKTHLHRLTCRMGLTSRTALAGMVERALASRTHAHEPNGASLAFTL